MGTFIAFDSSTSKAAKKSTDEKKPVNEGNWAMTILKWALIFFLVSIVAGVFGFAGLSAASADIARILFYIFGVIFIVLLLLGLTIFRA